MLLQGALAAASLGSQGSVTIVREVQDMVVAVSQRGRAEESICAASWRESQRVCAEFFSQWRDDLIQLSAFGAGVECLNRKQVRCGGVVCTMPELELNVDERDKHG